MPQSVLKQLSDKFRTKHFGKLTDLKIVPSKSFRMSLLLVGFCFVIEFIMELESVESPLLKRYIIVPVSTWFAHESAIMAFLFC